MNPPLKQPRQHDGFNGGINNHHRRPRRVALQSIDPGHNKKRHARRQDDNHQPANDPAGAADDCMAGGRVHLPPRDGNRDHGDRDQSRNDFPAYRLQEIHWRNCSVNVGECAVINLISKWSRDRLVLVCVPE